MVQFEWELPTRGDSRHVGSSAKHRGGWGQRPASALATDLRTGAITPFDDIDQLIWAVETAGYDTLTVPYDPWGEESWVTSSIALRATRHTRVAVGLHSGFGSPVYAAKVSATLQRLSHDRLDWALQVETDLSDDRARGDILDLDAKYRRAEEFLTVAKGVWFGAGEFGGGFAGGDFNYSGEFFSVVAGGLDSVIGQHAFPRVRISGNDPSAIRLSARHADIHLFELLSEGQLPDATKLIQDADSQGRSVALGLHLPVIARSSADEAYARLRRQWYEVHGPDSEASLRSHITADGVFTGFGEIGHRHSVGLFGDYESVASKLVSLSSGGIEHFVLSGVPNIEEVYRNTEHLLFRADPLGRVPSESEFQQYEGLLR